MLSCGHNQINHQDVRTGRHRLCHTAGLVTPFLFFKTMTKTAIIKMRIDQPTKDRWQANADAGGQSLSAYIRDMVEIGQNEMDAFGTICDQMEADRVKLLAK